MDRTETYDVAIVGASLVGVLAALELRGRGASVALFEHVMDNASLESLLEVPLTPQTSHAMPGREFADRVSIRLDELGVRKVGTAVGVHLRAVDTLVITTTDGRRHESTQLIYSPFGMESGLPWVPEIEASLGRGAFMDAWSDAAFFRGADVVVIGGDRRAAEQAVLAKEAGAKPTILCPFKAFEGRGLEERIREAEIPTLLDHSVIGLTTDAGGHLLAVQTCHRGERESMSSRAMFVAQGLVCNWSIFDEAYPRELMHPRVFNAGVASGIPYWDYAKQIHQVSHIAAFAAPVYSAQARQNG
jgi:thioredoxin reductase